MAALPAGESNFPDHHPDNEHHPHLMRTELTSPNSVQHDLTNPQFSNSKISPPPPEPFTPALPALGKRRKSKPVRYEASLTDDKEKHSPSKLKFVVRDPSRTCLSVQKENAETKGFNNPVQRSPAMIRAREVQSSLGNEHPSCIKSMVKSHVASGFWMGLPVPFCKTFLPKKDTTMVLEDENGEGYDVKYIAYKNGLSAGWKSFAFGHKLLEGDVLIFHLVETCKFKIYIVRANDLKEVDGALGLLNLEAHTEQATPDHADMVMPSPKTKRSKRPRSLPLTVVQKKHKALSPSSGSLPPPQVNSQPVEHSGNDSEEVASEVVEGSRTTKSNLSFEEVKNFEDFRIVINGLCIDSELPEDVRMNYYRLCLGKKEFLHDVLPRGLYYKLVAGMIGEIVSISNEINNCKLTTTKEDFEVWDNSLKSFELLGMKVGFLRDRIRVLVSLAYESEGALDAKKYAEARKQKNLTDDEIRKSEAKLVELKEASAKFDAVIDGLKQNAEKYEQKFEEAANAPW